MLFLQRFVEKGIRSAHPPQKISKPRLFFNFFINQTSLVNQGGRKRLPKFKFSAKFPIGLHVILQIQIKKFENDCYLM